MKTFKLLTHNKSFSEESLVISSKDDQGLTVGDVVEINAAEGECGSPILLQVTIGPETLQKGCISIDQSIAANFQLKQYMEVTLKVIDNLKDISLDSVELTFKDQYLARSDMWRLKTFLINKCLYLEKKLDIFGIRCQVFEMYIQGEKVASGIVTEETKIVYRSASSMVYLFIQMSCEMWDFDINGDLYFEKAIDGFLPDLFSKWKKLHCNHDVTIVLFSRTFYDAQSIDEFPSYMRECLQRDYKGRFFEDFYRVAVQNERYEDWTSTIILLKKLFNQYQDTVLKYHEKGGIDVPRAINSTSSQGNFLEVLNMSLNVFEKHFMDRSFDRTGQLSVVITPGVGFFEVDRELTIITKQRIIDNGIGSDLVCLGEQPLHAVPLFKFYNKQLPRNAPSVADDYNMPHWINLSFYSIKNQNIYIDFVPRIKLPTFRPEAIKERGKGASQSKRSRHASQPDPSFPVLFDYDEYDRQVFKAPAHSSSVRQTLSLQRPRKRKETPPLSTSCVCTHRSTEEFSRLTLSEPAPFPYQYSHSHASSAAIAIPRQSQQPSLIPSYQSSIEADNMPNKQAIKEELETEVTPQLRTIIGSDPSYESQSNKQCLTRRLKALVNPFNPSQITIKLTSNRRRWTHVFPLGPTGIFMQQHHYQAIPQISAATLISVEKASHSFSYELDAPNEYKPSHLMKRETQSSTSSMSYSFAEGRLSNSGGRVSSGIANDNMSWLCSITGDQEWTPAVTTGVDWKSLVIPACLPITTDYFPDRRSLQNDYVISDYILLPDDIIAENAVPKYFQNDEDFGRRSLTTSEVYKELICQRLQQGFQIILIPKQHISYPFNQVSSSPQYTPLLYKGQQSVEQMEEYLLSIGRIFHKLSLEGSKITVTHYRPRHPHREIKIHYCYRFHAPDSDTYGVSWVDFTSERLENYNWNYLDHYICNRGEGEFELKESLKYWRLRMLLLPAGQPETKKIIEGHERCDLYKKFSEEEKLIQRKNVLNLLEVMNKIRKIPSRKPKLKLAHLLPPRRSSVGQASLTTSGASSFRERLASNQVHDRPRMRSNSARGGARVDLVLPSGRVSPATEVDGRITISKSEKALTSSLSADNPVDFFPVDCKRLNENSPEIDIIQAMKHPQDGLNFIAKAGWSNFTFISFEAVTWLIEHVEGIQLEQQAITMLQSFLDKYLISHISRTTIQDFVHGFFLYYIVVPEDDEKYENYDLNEYSEDAALYLLQREWMEVEFRPAFSAAAENENYNFPSDEDIWSTPYLPNSKLSLKCSNIQIDQGTKSGRQEWGQLRYQNMYRPYEAFELVVEWMVATGNKAAEMVQSWARKSTQFGLQLVPIPSDPFALPFSDDSDPLRGPIFIPLDLSCFIDTSVQALDEEGLLKLQEKILCKFGFIPYRNPTNPANPSSSPPRYVHVSGSMFVMLPIRRRECKKSNGKNLLRSLDLHQISSPHDEYITRHFSGVKNKRHSAMNAETDTKIGFLWSWNYMITKRWKNTGTVDEHFMRKVMHDFKAFCANHDSRLEDFWKYSEMSDFKEDSSMVMDLES
ncbi:GATOR complex protein Iml1 isoform X2 [Parasteatoda tepidariorum]|uniref:GATOR complex protein Iml1 isoform X2 n=1 Tax=Parasteatoda tepidariorum TaxID=114398 RepID=UPI001C71DE1E|nr:GATOR complex protein Iml1 isoform X2 [Parasteatoda tepidariorum]